METKGWTTEINVHTLLARWALLVGATNAAHSHPEGYADTVLTVRADSTAWATQLRYLAPQLVAMLNEQLGDGTVTGSRFLVLTLRRGRRAAGRSAMAAARGTLTAEESLRRP